MDATTETINYTDKYYHNYWRKCEYCGHVILRKVVTPGRFARIYPIRCPNCNRLFKGY